MHMILFVDFTPVYFHNWIIGSCDTHLLFFLFLFLRGGEGKGVGFKDYIFRTKSWTIPPCNFLVQA